MSFGVEDAIALNASGNTTLNARENITVNQINAQSLGNGRGGNFEEEYEKYFGENLTNEVVTVESINMMLAISTGRLRFTG